MGCRDWNDILFSSLDIIIGKSYFMCSQLCTAPLSVSIIIYQLSKKHSRHAYNTEGVWTTDVWNKGQLDSTWVVPYDPCRIVHIRRQWNSQWEWNAMHQTVFNATMRETKGNKSFLTSVTLLHNAVGSLSLHGHYCNTKLALTCFTCSCQTAIGEGMWA